MKKSLLYSLQIALGFFCLTTYNNLFPMARLFNALKNKIHYSVNHHPTAPLTFGTSFLFGSMIYSHYAPLVHQKKTKTDIILHHVASDAVSSDAQNSTKNKFIITHKAPVYSVFNRTQPNSVTTIEAVLQDSPIVKDFMPLTYRQRLFNWKQRETLDDIYTKCEKPETENTVQCTTKIPTTEFNTRLNTHILALQGQRKQEEINVLQRHAQKNTPLGPEEEKAMILRSLSF